MDLWIPFYDQISDYFSTYFWLYHPGDPDHSANSDENIAIPIFRHRTLRYLLLTLSIQIGGYDHLD